MSAKNRGGGISFYLAPGSDGLLLFNVATISMSLLSLVEWWYLLSLNLPPAPRSPCPPTPRPPGAAGPRICCTCLWALPSSPQSPCLCFLWLSGGICYHSISRYRKAAWALGPHTKDKSSFHPIHA